ncbi:MAG TPA: alanine--tRNA ligase [Pyrinomonadaceae bacterium]|nr:alanine--tRNA ligase [Pyrinomonadaceae bacterium]
MTGNEIREFFLKYFEERGHRRVASSPLLPANDPTLLFTNAGMNQFKDAFLGLENRDYKRACSSQKCIRAGGKHNDLDEVGKTARHHTFFEMLGNFSFGDYFKREAIEYAWDFLVNKLKLDPERMWFTVFGGDDEVPADEEAAALWVEVGARPERVLRFGRKDNFWQMAETGPCGPNSEINYYLGEHPEDPEFNRADLVNGPGDTTMEIWNLVFMQYNRIEEEKGKYKLEPLPAPSVDTGAGLERLAVVMQGVLSNYDTDLIRPIIEFTAKLADRHYEPDTQEGFAMRVIADHARAAAFSIADGILPGNEGRNYVLRKIMRRAIYQGHHALQFEDSFFHKVTDFVVDEMREAYPEIEASRDFIERMVNLEEERFGSTLTVGLQKLDALFSSIKDGVMPDYKELARLYDTFGTPRDLVRVSLEERGFVIGEEEFNEAFDAALRELQQSGASVQAHGRAKVKPVYQQVLDRAGRSEFRGYEETNTVDARVVALIKGDEEVNELSEGEEGEVVLDRTPFYAEAGGQVGDTGVFTTSAAHANVNDTVSPVSGLIVNRVTVNRGRLRVGDEVIAQVDVEKRDATRRNHTATHLMHAALREVLGAHVKQAGSVVAPNYLRFDFTHYQPLSRDEIAEIERLVNYHILRNERVQTDVLPLEEAMRTGAMALFGEKYAEKVRVLSVPGVAGDVFSKELCGGTHVRATGDIGLFKITSDESIASGTRRIRAVTGVDALMRFQETEALVDHVANDLRASRQDIPATINRLQEELKRSRREMDELRLKIATGAIGASGSNGDEAREISGVRVLAREANGLDAAGMRQLSDKFLAQIKSGVVILGRSNDGKVSLIVRTSDDLTKRVPAGQVIKELAPIVGGRGGGKADMAEGGGSQPEKLDEALQASYQIVERMLGSNASAA